MEGEGYYMSGGLILLFLFLTGENDVKKIILSMQGVFVCAYVVCVCMCGVFVCACVVCLCGHV